MLLIFSKMLTIGLLLALGVLIYRLGIVSEAGCRELSALIINVCSPVMIVSNALADDSPFTLSKLGQTALACVLIYMALIAAGELLPRLLGVPISQRPFYTMLSLFGNVGFIGIPVSLSILGAASMLYVIIFNVFYSLLFYTYGLMVMSKASGSPIPFSPRSFVNAGTVSCLLAIAIYLFRFSLPQPVTDTLDYVSSATTFLSMLVLGINLATLPLKKILCNVKIYLFTFARILLLPILLALVMGQVLSDTMMVSTLALMAAMPAGNMPVMLATKYHLETDTLTSGIVTSTLLCLVTIPVVSLFFPI